MKRIVDTVAAELGTGVPRAKLRSWLHRGYITQHGHDHAGRALVDIDEVRAYRDRSAQALA